MTTIAGTRSLTPDGRISFGPPLSVDARARLYEIYREQDWRADDLAVLHEDLPQHLLGEFWDTVDRLRTRVAHRRVRGAA